MQLDDLKAAWTAHGNMLERSLAVNERLLREILESKVRRTLAPYVLWRALEVLLGVAALLVLAPLLAAHVARPRYLVLGGVVAMFAGGVTAFSAYLLVNCLKLDLGGPVTAIQRHLERLKLMEYRAFKWALLGGVLLWLPAGLILFEALTGVDALGRVDLGFLASNLLLGLIVLVLGHLMSKKYVERTDLEPWAYRLVDAVSGRGLRTAAGHLADLSRFEREEPPGGIADARDRAPPAS